MNIFTFVKIENSLAINKAIYFCQKLKNWNFLILKILSFLPTLENGMETFEADSIFEELVKIGRGYCPLDFFLEASFDTEKVEHFRKIGKKTDFFDKSYFCFMKTQV